MKITLADISKGKIEKPQKIVLYGTEGIGKSTFAADAPSPIFLTTEQGTYHLDVDRFPVATQWSQVLDALKALKSNHGYKTLVIDTLDALEPIVWAETCATKPNGDKRITSIEDYGFAKGYIYALDVWRELLRSIDVLVEQKGMSAILIAHAQIATFKSPDTYDWSRYDLKLHTKASALVREWADHVLFAHVEVPQVEMDDRIKALGAGNRIIRTTASAAWSAKSRGSVPAELPLSYEAWAAALDDNSPAKAAAIRERIMNRLAGIQPELAERVCGAIEKAGGNVATLEKIENKLRVTLSASEVAS